MAAKIMAFLITLSFWLSFIPCILSRSLDSPTTSVLDVKASLQQTHDVVSLRPQSLDEEMLKKPTNSSSSSYTLTLHPRSTLSKTHHKDYKTLSLSRLARDSARVNSVAAKIEFSVNGYSRSDLKPVDNIAVQPEDLSSPVTSGVGQGSGEYFARLGLGQPAKSYYMVIDTGSDITWLQCQPCTDCYQQTDPIYSPSASSSYSSVSCGSPQCAALEVSECRAGKCLYQVSYGDGSFTVGDFATETVSFGGSGSGSVPKVAVGCGHDNEGLFTGAAGLLGLGGGALSLTSQVKANSFSYCLVDRDSDSSSTLEFNSARPGDSVTAPLLRNSRVDTFYYVGLTGMSVGGHALSIPPSVFAVDATGRGGVIVDSGTAISRLQSQAYDALRSEFARLTTHLPSSSGFALFDTCYDLSSMTKATVPTVSFEFGSGKSLALKASNYLIPVDDSGKFCFAFAPTDGKLSIIGNVQQQGTRVSYDLANKIVGFSPNKC